jgi:hypothetical protein
VLPEPITIAEWWKNRRGESIRVSLSTYADRNLIDLRTWSSADGRLKPGKGFSADIRHLKRILTAFGKAADKATQLGLITDDNHDTGGAHE